MRILFLYVAKKLSDGDRLPHWELLMDAYSEIMAQNSTSDWSTDGKTEYLSTNKSSEKELMAEDEYAFQENKLTFGKDLKNYNIENSVINNLEEKSVLDVIIEATYNMYANELRYDLIYAVFVKPIQMQMFLMPNQVQRQIKLAHSRGSFDVKLRERLEEVARESIIKNGKKRTNDTRKNPMIEDFEIPPTPLASLNEEEILANNSCRFILPLIEAKEAAQIFEILHGRKSSKK
ncbi:PREDICTED: uncharacterized protein LOC105152652 [Acromyrmex echinatior]|uniref:uncharacterized protein LOC105152652 n=1 Tax=Acromyrmex echinatior TaxID=103372 RepID=UPI000580D1A0|nr:PREDICTED: uncharacterized protein LOC105152652 [Acromyrmex echinatior]